MDNVLLIDGNSIMNRAFYGIMGNKMLTTKDGKYTNAVYGFLSIMFKNIEEVKPKYILIAFDSKTGANNRKQIYEGYKKSRHGMPNELAEQMPVIKDILKAMNIQIVELPDYEGDDILGSASKVFSKENKKVYILSGDRDLFQLVDENINIIIPRTKMGKTETEIYDIAKVNEEYQLEPKDLIELKALMGDSSDEIPGVPGIGPKTGTVLIKKYKTIENIYKELENGTLDVTQKIKDKLKENKQLAEISKQIGTININANIVKNIQDYKVIEWDKEKVANIFKELNFNRFLDRFNLNENVNLEKEEIKIEVNKKNIQDIEIENELIFYLEIKQSQDITKIIKKEIVGIGIYDKNKNIIYIKLQKSEDILKLKDIFENEKISKIGYNLKEDYVLLKEYGITMKGIKYDAQIATYVLNPSNNKQNIKDIAYEHLNIELEDLIPKKEDSQLSLFSEVKDNKEEIGVYVYILKQIYIKTMKEIKKQNLENLLNNIEIPLIIVLGEMQYNGIIVEKEQLEKTGKDLKERLNIITQKIYELAEEEFNINSTKQLGNILFEKLKLPEPKKKKTGYATDVETLEKLINEHPIIEKILDYRRLAKLNSTYVEGLITYINPKDSKIHAVFNQTITATGRISCTEPNLQNIPTHEEEGKNIKKAFKPKEGYVYIDADYSQIELRVLAHIAKDEKMIKAFKNDQDIHKEVAAKVFSVPIEEVTAEQRYSAKAVNFGIIYGITAFGLSGQLKVNRKIAQEYIDNYLEKYSGIKSFMDNIVKNAEEQGYVETMFGRRRYVPELKSNNFLVRQFGTRVAMNTPIQGTAADIMKIAMNKLYENLQKLDAKIILQVHDELIIEVKESQKEEAKQILKQSMENAVSLQVPLKVDISESKTWYEAK